MNTRLSNSFPVSWHNWHIDHLYSMDHHCWHETISILQLQIKKCKCLATVNCKMMITAVMETNTLVDELQWFHPQFEPLYIALPSSFTVICCILALPAPDKYRCNVLKHLVDWPAYDSHFCLLASWLATTSTILVAEKSFSWNKGLSGYKNQCAFGLE